MGIQKQESDPEYLRAKYAFTRDLIQFHESRGTGLQCDPKINGKEVDLYLLYQIVTSHGGWEKINLRNEWDKLLEHFHMPRSTNGGLAIKQIYLRYLELYEKIHYLGEDVDSKEDQEDEYESDFRGRRRYPNKLSSSSHHHHHHHHHHHSSASSHHHHPKEISDHNRSQLGLSSRVLESSDYAGLLLSLQSPLPNEQDMAISVCTLLSNETKHVLRFSKSPAILNMLLAHAGIYQDCGMRLLMEETYKDSRDMDYAEFWDDVLHNPDTRQLLCECFAKRMNVSLGLTEDEGAIISRIQEIEDGDLSEEEKFSLGIALRLRLRRIRDATEGDQQPSSSSSTSADPPPPLPSSSSSPEEDQSQQESSSSISNSNTLPTLTTTISTKEPQSTESIETVDLGINPKLEQETEISSSPKNSTNLSNNHHPVESEGSLNNSQEEQSSSSTMVDVVDDKSGANNSEGSIVVEDELSSEVKVAEPPKICCSSCPCQRLEQLIWTDDNANVNPTKEFSIQFSKHSTLTKQNQMTMEDHYHHYQHGDKDSGPMGNSLPHTLQRTQNPGDKVGQRISQIAHILRNLSFEQDNAFIMSRNPTLMRFLLVAANCTFSSLAQAAFDIIGNISSHIQLDEPLSDPISSMFLTLVTSSVFSSDRFKILRSLEAIRELAKAEGNETIVSRYVESSVYRRMCDLLTLSDIMLLIYTLECILSMTELGEVACDEIVRVQGSVATLVSLVTVEAQSYGPKGCILMRVVETVTGANSTTSSSQQPTSSSSLSSSSTSQPQPSPSLASLATISQSAPPQQTQHLLQQQLQQPPNPIYSPSPSGLSQSTTTAGRPSPASSPNLKIVTGTTVVPPVIQGQIAHPLQQYHNQQPQQVNRLVSLPSTGQNVTPTSNSNISFHNNQIFSHSLSASPANPNLSNHLNSSSSTFPQIMQSQSNAPSTSQVIAVSSLPAKQQLSALPVSLSENRASVVKNANCNNVHIGVQGTHSLPAGAATVVIQHQQQNNQVNSVTTQGIATTTVNGIPSLVSANLPQISNHNLNHQHHVVAPSISIVTPRGTLSEEAWAIAWLKGSFEPISGASIEQGEIYRMYSASRKNPNVVLSLEQFIQCVRCAYGASVGPVIKQFGGGTSPSFFEGIKPKIAIRAVGVTAASAVQLQAATLKAMGGAGAAKTVVAAVTTSTNPQLPHQQVPIQTSGAPTIITNHPQPSQIQLTSQPTLPPPPTTTTITTTASTILTPVASQVETEESSLNNNNDNSNVDGATNPVSVHIPSREAKPSLSPILQATLSLPPKAKGNLGNNNTSSSVPTPLILAKNQKKIKEKVSSKRKKEVAAATAAILSGNSASFSGAPSSLNKGSSGGFSPTSCAIRSLLASKVVQRQQNKLHQQLPTKNSKTGVNEKVHIGREDGIQSYSPSEVVKVNGIGPDIALDKTEESSASSSLLSSDGSENCMANKTSVPITSFQGVLVNGQANLDIKNDLNLDATEESEGGSKNRHMKGMLIDLLERRVPARETMNGIVAGREIRISEKGLELIEKMEETTLASGTSAPALINHNNSTCPSSENEESQKMTFYSSTSDAQVTLQGQAACVIPAPGLSGSAVTLASGGGTSMTSTNSTTFPVRPQQVKLSSGKFVRVIEHATVPLCAAATTFAAVASSAAITAEVHSATVPSAPSAFCHGDGLISTVCATDTVTATPANGDVTYVVDESGQSTMIVDMMESVLANANSVSLDNNNSSGNNGEGGGGGVENMLINYGDGNNSSSSNTHSSNGTTHNNNVNPETECNNGVATVAGGDLLEKFSQFSDLIVVPPEQLASLKRPSSPIPSGGTVAVVPGNNNNNQTVDLDIPPPIKKQAIDSSAVICKEEENNVEEISTIAPVLTTTSTSVCSIPATISIQNNTNNNSTTIVTATGTMTSTVASLPAGSGAQVVQLPLRLSVNPQNPQQLTFTRQLVLPSGQQLLLSTGNSQSALQGQVIISKPQGSTTDQLPKAIIILQPQHQKQQQGQVVSSSQTPSLPVTTQQQLQTVSVVATTAATLAGTNTAVLQQHVTVRPPVLTSTNIKPQIVSVQQHPQLIQQVPVTGTGSINNPSQQQLQKIVTSPAVQSQQTPIIHHVVGASSLHAGANMQSTPIISNVHSLANTSVIKASSIVQFEGIRACNYPHLTQDQLDAEFPYLCEWAGCGLRFLRPQQVSMHALKIHCPEAMVDEVRCEWGQNGCDPLLRKRFSLMTHLQDRHCSKQALEMALYRRKNKIEPPPVPQQPIHHPGYAPNAAFHAIKRHAMSFMSTKEHLHDDNEGPVTKSIRLTAALILRNLVNYSGLGRRMLRGYESHLSLIAMSNVESSRTIAQLLHDMNDPPTSLK